MPRSQAEKLGLKARTQLSPVLEKCSLVASAKASYQEASEDLELMTGIAVSHSSLHRLVPRVELPTAESPRQVNVQGR